jgi:hypothetical protein
VAAEALAAPRPNASAHPSARLERKLNLCIGYSYAS